MADDLIAGAMYAARGRAKRYDLARKWLLLVVIVGGSAVAAIAPDWPRLSSALAIVLVAAGAASVIAEQTAREQHRNADDYRRLLGLRT